MLRTGLSTGVISKVSKCKHIKNVNCLQSRSLQFRMPWKKKDEEPPSETSDLQEIAKRRRAQEEQGQNIRDEFSNTLARKRKSLTNRNAYRPPENLEERLERIVAQSYDTTKQEWTEVKFTENRLKFKVLTQMIKELKHDIPCATLSQIHTAGDALDYFRKEVRVSTTLEDMAQQKLPPNLNIQLEPIRFDRNKDPLYGGMNAFPGSDTIVKSIKFRRKYASIKNTVDKPGYVNQYYDY